MYDADRGPGITVNAGNGSSITWGDKSGNNLLPAPIQAGVSLGVSEQVYWVPYEQYFNSTVYSADAQAGSAALHVRGFVDDKGLNGFGGYLGRGAGASWSINENSASGTTIFFGNFSQFCY